MVSVFHSSAPIRCNKGDYDAFFFNACIRGLLTPLITNARTRRYSQRLKNEAAELVYKRGDVILKGNITMDNNELASVGLLYRLIEHLFVFSMEARGASPALLAFQTDTSLTSFIQLQPGRGLLQTGRAFRRAPGLSAQQGLSSEALHSTLPRNPPSTHPSRSAPLHT